MTDKSKNINNVWYGGGHTKWWRRRRALIITIWDKSFENGLFHWCFCWRKAMVYFRVAYRYLEAFLKQNHLFCGKRCQQMLCYKSLVTDWFSLKCVHIYHFGNSLYTGCFIFIFLFILFIIFLVFGTLNRMGAKTVATENLFTQYGYIISWSTNNFTGRGCIRDKTLHCCFSDPLWTKTFGEKTSWMHNKVS